MPFDLSSSFKTIDHSILSDVPHKKLCVHDTVYIWFNSYLTDQTQVFCTSSSTSDVIKLDCSVPEGLVVEPQQFSAYTEEIEKTIASHTIDHHLYADNTQLQAHVYPQELRSCLFKNECCVGTVKDWCSRHRLQINPDKTELIVFGSKAGLNRLQQGDTSLHLESVIIKSSESVHNHGM